MTTTNDRIRPPPTNKAAEAAEKEVVEAVGGIQKEKGADDAQDIDERQDEPREVLCPVGPVADFEAQPSELRAPKTLWDPLLPRL